MKKNVIGVDVSKDTLDYCILDVENHSKIGKGTIANEEKAILKWLREFDVENTIISFEHTGHYGALLAWVLEDSKFVYYIINPLDLQRSLGIQRGKSDVVDAYRIAEYTIGNKHKLSPFKLPSEGLRKLKVLMTARERYVKIAVQIKNSLKAEEILATKVDIKKLITLENQQLNVIEKTIKALEKEMMDILKSIDELQLSYKKITRIIGVGPITALKCIIETDNFMKFTDARKFNCHCGLAPFPYQSGSSIKGRTKTHFLRDKTLKTILFNAAGSAIQHDPQLRNYYLDKIEKGKHKLTALNAVANKIVLRIFAVVKREEPFVKLTT
ncbi:IS110 family transposase [Flavobacterium sp. xlx-214]|uniref:IS110 family transposase n=1 Tax=Flavobacterium sp. xlx-214 TaxID=2654325 RepID=UPI0015EF325F|nr:IS110 family transposase [Flavobacterium sp. xlx-214]QMI82799.1 IS110 family transposase [Flavobacterium sp. xlx-214]